MASVVPGPVGGGKGEWIGGGKGEWEVRVGGRGRGESGCLHVDKW